MGLLKDIAEAAKKGIDVVENFVEEGLEGVEAGIKHLKASVLGETVEGAGTDVEEIIEKAESETATVVEEGKAPQPSTTPAAAESEDKPSN